MIKTYCDMCGKEIDCDIDQVNLDFNHYGVVKFERDKEKQLCVGCADKVIKFIDEETTKTNS